MENGDDYFSWCVEGKLFIYFDLILYSQKFVLRKYFNPKKKKFIVAPKWKQAKCITYKML